MERIENVSCKSEQNSVICTETSIADIKIKVVICSELGKEQTIVLGALNPQNMSIEQLQALTEKPSHYKNRHRRI